MDSSTRNRKDAASGPEEPESFYRLINTSSVRELDETEKILAMVRLTTKRNMIWPAKLDNKLFQIVRDSNEWINFTEKTMGNWRVELTAGGRSLPEGKIQSGRYITGRCTITITICNRNDAAQPHTQEMHRRIQTYQIARKDQSPMYIDDIKLFAKKRKRIGNPYTGSEDI